MRSSGKITNVALGGGGVKGIAYIGAFDVMEKRGYIPGNMAGVSAGSLAGGFAAAGYDAAGMWNAMGKFDFDKIQVGKLKERVPVIDRFMNYAADHRETDINGIIPFFASGSKGANPADINSEKPGILKSIVTYSKEGCLFDGDLLEEWISKTLAAKGIRTFGDLRSGKADSLNPRGYKIRMTGVDCNRVKIVTLPDDAAFYGIDPDKFEVAKAIRISTAVPFAFKPVELAKSDEGKRKVYNLVDGGVLDSFPGWLLPENVRGLGYKLNAGENKIFSLDTPLSILKGLISAVHDIGGKAKPDSESFTHLAMGEIDTRKVGFLDFSLSAEDKLYLYNSGKTAAEKLLDSLGEKSRSASVNLPYGFQRVQRWRTRLHE